MTQTKTATDTHGFTRIWMGIVAAILLCSSVFVRGPLEAVAQDGTQMPTLAELQKMTARFAPADIGADLTALPKNEREALARLVDAAVLAEDAAARVAPARDPVGVDPKAEEERRQKRKGPATSEPAYIRVGLA